MQCLCFFVHSGCGDSILKEKALCLYLDRGLNHIFYHSPYQLGKSSGK